MTGQDQLEEARLRRALRLEADEVPPRLDAVLIAAAARTARPTGSDVVPVAAAAFAAGWIVSEMWRAALAAVPSVLGEGAFRLAIDAFTEAAIVLAPAATLAASAALPLTAAAAALIAIALGQRRTHA
ncbi:MAG: hypothetical protein A2082_06340 [Chloroflexi bacterium GWC2_70_10]|nr:MAG: hypothetical protein A2082_06340 [Chloroflexi bacterium GWC2_70_10]